MSARCRSSTQRILPPFAPPWSRGTPDCGRVLLAPPCCAEVARKPAATEPPPLVGCPGSWERHKKIGAVARLRGGASARDTRSPLSGDARLCGGCPSAVGSTKKSLPPPCYAAVTRKTCRPEPPTVGGMQSAPRPPAGRGSRKNFPTACRAGGRRLPSPTAAKRQ